MNLECAAVILTEKTKVAIKREVRANGKIAKTLETVITTLHHLAELVKVKIDDTEIVSFKEKNLNESLSTHSQGACTIPNFESPKENEPRENLHRFAT